MLQDICPARMSRRFCLAFLLCLALQLTTAAENWPQFRGPNASGLATNAALPVRWSVESGENVRWKTPIPGLAHSSPIVWGSRVFVATAVKPGQSDLRVGLYGDIKSIDEKEPNQWRLLALDRVSGKVFWNTLAHESIPRVKRHTKATHCNSTPATDGKHIVAIFGSEGLFCFDMDGRLVWKKNLGPMDSGYFQVPTAQWGFASSPVIHDGKVVVQCDVQKDSFLAVFDLADGRELWRTPRKDVPTWSTPTLAKVGTQTHILVNGWHHTGGYDFTTGKEIWKLDGGGDIPVPAPVLGTGVAFFTSAHGRFRPMQAIRLDAQGDITPAEVGGTNKFISWAHARQGCYMQTPILVGAHLFGCLDTGVLNCFDAQTGAIKFSERLVPGGQGFTASPVSDGRHLYFTSELGNVFVVPADGSFRITATNALGETCLSTPAGSDGALLFRTRSQLLAIGANR